MLPNGIEPPLKMLTNAQKIHATDRLLQDLTKCEKALSVPGNYHAKQRRRFHDDSKLVFPENKTRKNREDFETHYNSNFQRYQPCRPRERPCSPTRRNNPHPSKNFLTWRIPTRVFDYGKSKTANISFLNSNIDDSFQSFYNDYSGRRGERSANAVDAKMLLEMTKSYSGAEAKKKENKKKGKIILKSGEPSQHALTLPSLLRKSWSPSQSSRGLPGRSGKDALSPLFLKEELQPLFQSWYDAASSKDKGTVSKTPTVVAEIEESYIQKALEKALKPDAIEAIEEWLQDANEEEREIAMQFIQTILLASLQRQKLEKTAETQTKIMPPYRKNLTPLHRDQLLPPTVMKSKPHHHTKACKVCARKNLEGALEHLQAVATMPHDTPGITELINPLHPGVLAQKEERKRFVTAGRRRLVRPKKKSPEGTKSSLFQTTKKAKSRHFTIHPEWY
ncbi:uncharacterized protein [Clytia hemisphaerica]|uniref:Uncharacterized protein n=1 Tax=Clytia hemisphaerica TaxID=252671 RepID=A0A7M5X2T8_9CNID